MPENALDTKLLIDAAEDAGEIALKYFRKDFEVHDKGGDLGPVTEADLEINAMLAERLRGARPDYGWLSEESTDTAARLSRDRVFIIDPIDGTRSFVAGEPGFSVSLAVAERGRIVAAAVHLPARGETYAATLGEGAVMNGRRLSVTGPESLAEATVLTARIQMAPEHWPGGVPPMERHFRSSLAWRMSLVAAGRFDSMLTFRGCFEWDIAAGTLIAGEAGVHVSDGLGAQPFFNSPDAMVPGIIAAPPGLHAQILACRRPID